MTDTELPNKLLQSTPEGTFESTASWAIRVMYTVSPLFLKAAFSPKIRKCILKTVSHYKNEREQERIVYEKQRALAKQMQDITDSCVKNNKLQPLSQKQFEEFEIKDGMRICEPGYDYSLISPGKTSCLFIDLKDEQGNSLHSFLGHNKKWPNGSSFGKGCTFGISCSSGQKSKMWGCKAHDYFVLEEGSIICDSKIGNHPEFKDACIGLGNVEIGDGPTFGRNVTFKPSIQSDNNHGGYRIGNGLVAGENFKLYGKDNHIGHNAKLSPGYLVSNSVIGYCLKADGGMLASCLVNGDQENFYELNDSKIIANQKDYTILKGAGIIKDSKVDNYCLLDTKATLENSQFDINQNIPKGCKFINCEIKGTEDVQITGRDSNFSNCSIENITLKDCKIDNSNVMASKVIDSSIKGDDSSVVSSYISGVVTCKGNVLIDKESTVNGYLKIYNNKLHSDLMPDLGNDAKLLLSKCVLEGNVSKTFNLHRPEGTGKQKITLRNCDFTNVEKLHANLSNITLKGTTIPKECNWEPVCENVVRSSATEQTMEPPLPEDPILDGYEESVQQHYQQQSSPLATKVEFIPHESNLVPPIDEENPKQNQNIKSIGPRR